MRVLICSLALLGTLSAQAAEPEFSGYVRGQWTDRHDASGGPLAQANRLQPGLVALPAPALTLETELRAASHGFNAIFTAQQQRSLAHGAQGAASQERLWFNELAWSGSGAGWQFSVGKKVVSWDVGYAFRPNDMVQREERLTLVSSTPEGRPLLMAEHFAGDRAWSLVAVNPNKPSSERGAKEPALAARVYQRDGSVDWHGFARVGSHTGGSLGAAVAWVATDALELHASLRRYQHVDSLVVNPSVAPLVASNPLQPVRLDAGTQALIGGTWTNADQISLLAEAWWDGSAPSNSQWDQWAARGDAIRRMTGFGAPAAAVAGNLAWQANAFSAASSLRQTNLFTRLSWQHEAWEPALDLLYHPADGGRLVTASLLWKGDRVQVQGGVRVNAGPQAAVLMQTPTRRTGYVAGTWNF